MIYLLLEYPNQIYVNLLYDCLHSINFFDKIDMSNIQIVYLFDKKSDITNKLDDLLIKKIKNKLQNCKLVVLFGSSIYNIVNAIYKNKLPKSTSFLANYINLSFVNDNINFVPTLNPGYIIRSMMHENNDIMKDKLKSHLIIIKNLIITTLR